MKIVITGTSGLVGHDLWPILEARGHQLWGVGRKKPEFVPFSQWKTSDIMDAGQTYKTVTQINPDCLIHLAAISNPDECEKDPTTAYKANALGTRNLALACQKFDAEMVYVSTDQVFNGKKKSPYTEMDSADAINHYGKAKLWGEQFVQALLRRFYIARTALVFGTSRPTFIHRVARSILTEEETVTAATDIVNSPTYSKDLANALAFLIDTHIYGLYHVANEGHCSRLELAQFIAQSLGKKPKSIKKGSRKQLKLPAPRPGYTPLENFVWNLNGFPKMRTWQEAVVEFLHEMPD